MEKVPFKVAIATTMDETAEACDLVLPALHAIESFGDAESARGVNSILQPAMKKLPMFDARPAGEALIALGKAGGVGAAWPDSWLDYVKARWKPMHARHGAGRDFDDFWNDVLQRGGVFDDAPESPVRWSGTPAFSAPRSQGARAMSRWCCTPRPTCTTAAAPTRRGSRNCPDPTSKATWGTWAEIHPETAKRLGVAQGDPLKIETEAGSLELPVYLYAGIRKDVVAVPLGQGHTAYGRYANGLGANALALLSPAQDAASGALAYLSAKAHVSKGAKAAALVLSQREKNQYWREIAQVIPLSAIGGLAVAAHAGADSVAVQTPAAHGRQRPCPGAHRTVPDGEGARCAHRADDAPRRLPAAGPHHHRVRARRSRGAARSTSRWTWAATRTPSTAGRWRSTCTSAPAARPA